MSYQLPEPFNPLDHNPSQGAGKLPVGRHTVIITDSSVVGVGKAEVNGQKVSGQLVLNLRVMQGDAAGATGVYRLNYFNANEVSRDIAKRQLSAVAYAIGQLQTFTDTAVLHNRPFQIDVALQPEPNEKGYTEVTRVYDANGNEPGSTVTAAQSSNGFGQTAAAPAPAPAPQQQAAATTQAQYQPAAAQAQGYTGAPNFGGQQPVQTQAAGFGAQPPYAGPATGAAAPQWPSA